FRSLRDDAVVHVRDVHDLDHLVSLVPQGAAQEVRGHEAPEITDVAAVVDGEAADVHAHLGRLLRLEGHDRLAQGVEESKVGAHKARRTRAVRSSEQPAGLAQLRAASRIRWRATGADSRPQARTVSESRSSPNSRSS